MIYRIISFYKTTKYYVAVSEENEYFIGFIDHVIVRSIDLILRYWLFNLILKYAFVALNSILSNISKNYNGILYFYL